MKLSDLFTNLADGARNFEARVTKWQEELDAKGADLEAGARRRAQPSTREDAGTAALNSMGR